MINIMVVLLLYIVGNTIGCAGGGSWVSPPSNLRMRTTKQEYWTPKPDVKAKWEIWHYNWTKAWKQKLADAQKKNGTDGEYYDDGPGSDAPHDWHGLGPGLGGQDPPPWAVLKGDGGKPDFCFEEPSYGDCDENQSRWGYNPFVKECQKFKYSGCGGNHNNFRDKVQCAATCEVSPRPNCATYD